MGMPASAGARVVVLDEALAPLPVGEAALGLEANWRVGPASKPVSDRSYRALSFTPEGVGLRPFSVGHVEQPWRTARDARRSGDSLDPPLARAGRRQLDRAGGSAGRGERGLRGGDPRRAAVRRTLTSDDDQRHLHRRRADRRLGRAAGSRRHARRSASSSSPPSSGGAPRSSSPCSSEGAPCPTPAPTSCCRTCWRHRRRSTSPSTRRCGCSTGSCSSPSSTAI